MQKKIIPGLVSCPFDMRGVASVVTTPQDWLASETVFPNEGEGLFCDELTVSTKSPWKKSESSSVFDSLLVLSWITGSLQWIPC